MGQSVQIGDGLHPCRRLGIELFQHPAGQLPHPAVIAAFEDQMAAVLACHPVEGIPGRDTEVNCTVSRLQKGG